MSVDSVRARYGENPMRRSIQNAPSLILIVASCLILPATARAQATGDKAQLAVLEQLERSMVYQPRKYKPEALDAFKRSGGTRLDFTTKDGRQTAWLVPPANPGAPGPPQKLWV